MSTGDGHDAQSPDYGRSRSSISTSAIGRLAERPLVAAQADREQPRLDCTGAELVPRFNETIEMKSADPSRCLGFTGRGGVEWQAGDAQRIQSWLSQLDLFP